MPENPILKKAGKKKQLCWKDGMPYLAVEEATERQYTQTLHTEDFQKAVLSTMMLFNDLGKMIQQKKSFRMEVKYDAEAQSVITDIYAPTESLSTGSKPEC